MVEDHQTSIHQTARWWQLKHFLFSPPGEMIQCDVRIFLSNGLVKNHQKPIQWLAVSSWFSVCNPVVSLARWWFHIIFFVFTPSWGRWTQVDEHIFSNGLVQPPTSKGNLRDGFPGGEVELFTGRLQGMRGGGRSFDVSTGGVFLSKNPGGTNSSGVKTCFLVQYFLFKN